MLRQDGRRWDAVHLADLRICADQAFDDLRSGEPSGRQHWWHELDRQQRSRTFGSASFLTTHRRQSMLPGGLPKTLPKLGGRPRPVVRHVCCLAGAPTRQDLSSSS